MNRIIERTTDLENIRKGEPYTWGEVVRIHEIDEYTFVEYNPWQTDGVMVKTGYADDRIMFSVYLQGQNIALSYPSLDQALIGVLAYKYDGPNSQAAMMYWRMLNGREGEK